MWQSLITLGNEVATYGEYIERRLSKVQGLSFVAEAGKTRTLYHMAASDYEAQSVRRQVENIVADVILVRVKLDFIISRLKLKSVSLPVAALLSSLIYFEAAYERKLLVNHLREESEFSIDGIVNFRLSKLKKNWEELASLTKSLLDLKARDKEIFNLILFISGNGRDRSQTLLIADDGDGVVITNVTRGNVVDVFPVFDDKRLDVVNAVISQNPTELIIEGANCDRKLSELFKNIFKVKTYS